MKSQKPWPTKKLGEVLISLESGSRPKGGVRHIFDGFPSIGAEHLDDRGGFNFEKIKFIPREFYEKLRRGIIKYGDILVVKDGATTGRVSLVAKNFPFRQAAVNEHVFILRPDTKQILSKYLFHFLFSKDGQGQVLNTFHGAAQGGINSNFVNYIRIPLPPIEEQKRIVRKIENLFAKIDEVQRLKQESISASSALLPSALYQIFSRAKKESWPTKKLGEVCSISGGDSAPQEKIHFQNGTIPFVRMRDLGRYHVTDNLIETLDYLTEKIVKERRIRIWPKGSILMPRSGSVYLNHRAILGVDAAVVSHVAILSNFKSDIWNKYLFYYLTQLDIGVIAQQTTGLDVIRFEQLKKLKIPLPPIEEQKKIVAYLDSISAKTRELQNLQQQTSADISALRQSILHKVFAKQK